MRASVPKPPLVPRAQVFSSFGPVRSVSMIPNPDTGKHKGYGFVDFEKAESAAQVPPHPYSTAQQSTAYRAVSAAQLHPRPAPPTAFSRPLTPLPLACPCGGPRPVWVCEGAVLCGAVCAG
jgi:hypothetical protein